MTDTAPFFADLASAPDGQAAEGGRAYWLRTSDGVRIRMALWPKGTKGTVLLFPGRTEYIEKYGPAAAEFLARGYAMVAVDWRGQGLADRPSPDPMMGHVTRFADYQSDVAAVMAKLADLGQPGPFFVVGHSMGGAIGLRALMQGLPVQAAAFSAPMWGIHFSPGMEQAARLLSKTARLLRQSARYAPGTGPLAYVLTTPFAGNVLTRDVTMYGWMQHHLMQHPELALGGPSLHWLGEALAECRTLAAMPSPAIPCFCALGSVEKVVDSPAIHARMSRWPGGKLDLVPDSEHEGMMEILATRHRFFDNACRLFDVNR